VYSAMLFALLLRGRRPEIFRETASRAESTTSITICGRLSGDETDHH
jgi:hypothetical protein